MRRHLDSVANTVSRRNSLKLARAPVREGLVWKRAPLNLGKHVGGWIGMLLVLAILGAGCGHSGGQPDARAFDQAPLEIKADWEMAIAADQAGDYFTASTAYARIARLESQLTRAQFDSVVEASRLLSQRMMAAAEQGDPAAREAMRQLMAAQR